MRSSSQLCSTSRVDEQEAQRPGECLDVGWWHEEAVHAVTDHLGWAASSSGDDGTTCSHRFDDDLPEAFRRPASVHDHRRSRELSGHVLTVPDEVDPIRDTEFGREERERASEICVPLEERVADDA